MVSKRTGALAKYGSIIELCMIHRMTSSISSTPKVAVMTYSY